MVEPSLLEWMEVGDVLYAVPKSINGTRRQWVMSEKLVWSCHICHEWMPQRTTGRGHLEWHICDKCMEEDNEWW